MSFPTVYREIREMVMDVALETPTARAIARKAGLRSVPATGIFDDGWPVLTHANHPNVVDDYPESHNPLITDEEATFLHGIPNDFTLEGWSKPASIEWWPEGSVPGAFTATTDLSQATELLNRWYIIPGYSNPDANIRVLASLDGVSWDYPTEEGYSPFDWTLAGASVNCGAWLGPLAPDGRTYENYPPFYDDLATSFIDGVSNALPGGVTGSGWHTLREGFREEVVHLRWRLDWTHDYEADPYYDSFTQLTVGYAEVRIR